MLHRQLGIAKLCGIERFPILERATQTSRHFLNFDIEFVEIFFAVGGVYLND